MSNLVGEIQAKMVRVLEQHMDIGRIYVGPQFYLELMQEMFTYNTAFAPKDVEHLFGCPVVVVRDVVRFEVSIR